MPEHNILDTVENNKYHSCVILGFSYDPIFFDEVIYPSLKKRGIVNLLVFVDNMMLEQSLERVITDSFRKSDGYSLCGIRAKSTFHPKVLQFFGEKSSRTLIGSGNPTFGGYSRNHELWFSFQTEIEDMREFHIISDVWNYIKKVTGRNGGIIEKKLRMVEDHSSFYDEKLSILKALEEDLYPKKINLFIQPEYAVISVDNIKKLSKTFDFYNIDGLFKRQGKSSNRYIHAKLYEFFGKK